MANLISEFVDVNISVEDLRITQAGFGTPLILPEEAHSAFTSRTQSYTTIAEVAEDFATTTKTYKEAAAIFSQSGAPSIVKIGRKDAGDSDLTDTLNEISIADNDWYCLILEEKTEAQILLAAAWIETQRKIFVADTEDSDILEDVDTDIASQLEALAYNRTAPFYHHQVNVDLTGLAIEISGGTATVTKSSHGLRDNDPITILGATPSELNGNKTITLIGDDTFSYSSTSPDGSATGTITAFARHTAPSAAWAGDMLGRLPGAATWKFKQLTGINPTPTSIMGTTEKANVLGKNANVYVEVASVGITQEGTMASGRFIDIQRGIDWLQARIEEAVFTRLAALPKIPYSNAGTAIIENELRGVLDEAIRRGVLQPLLNDEDNRPYVITIPDVASVSSADRTNRILNNVNFSAQLAGAIHSVVINGKISI